MRIDILTLFPAMFQGVLGESMLKIAQEKGILRACVTNLRDFTTDRHKTVDDRPYGGGPGMVMKPDPVVAGGRSVRTRDADVAGRLLLMCPRGRRFDRRRA